MLKKAFYIQGFRETWLHLPVGFRFEGVLKETYLSFPKHMLGILVRALPGTTPATKYAL
jgi:hypothetical protein